MTVLCDGCKFFVTTDVYLNCFEASRPNYHFVEKDKSTNHLPAYGLLVLAFRRQFSTRKRTWSMSWEHKILNIQGGPKNRTVFLKVC